MKYYKLAADQDLTITQCDLGYCYQHGVGVDEDKKQAVKYFKLAADQGHAAAQCNLGVLL